LPPTSPTPRNRRAG